MFFLKIKWLCFTLALLMLVGCADVTPLLQPPRVDGQYAAVQQTLEAALKDEGNASFVMKYPLKGELTAAVLLLDETGRLCETDAAVMAVTFYAQSHTAVAHIRLLRRLSDGWQTVADVAGQGADIHKIALADIDGNGQNELLVGFDVYSKEYPLHIFSLEDSLKRVWDGKRYTDYFVGDMTADGKDDVIFLHIAEEQTVTATLGGYTSDGFAVLGTARLDGEISSFEKLLYGKISDGQMGLYVDARQQSGNYLTEILLWDGENLQAPLYDADTNQTLRTQRAAKVAVMDVDGNGVPEYPSTARLKNATDAKGEDTEKWLTEWYGYDVVTDTVSRRFAGIVNQKDGYYLELEDEWIPQLTVEYDEDKGILWVKQEDQTPVLAVQNAGKYQMVGTVQGFAFEKLPGQIPVYIWYDGDAQYRLTTEKISYMLISLT